MDEQMTHNVERQKTPRRWLERQAFGGSEATGTDPEVSQLQDQLDETV